jgi:hypothetical protein
MSETFTISQGNFDLVITAGTTWPNAFEPAVFYPTDNVGAPFDLTGWTAKVQFRESPFTSAHLDVIPTVNVTENSVSFSLTAAQTALFTKVAYVWACELTETSTGKVIELARGKVEVNPEIVKAD